MKGRHDVVTAMDREVERFIRARDREALSAGRDHRRGGGRRRRRPPVAHRSDRRHRELRARTAALLRVDRLPRARRADARRDLRSQPRLAVRGGARRRRVARRRAASRVSHDRRHAARPRSNAAGRRGGRRRRTSTCSARVLDAGGAIRRAGSGALGLADVAAGASRPTPSCTSTRGTAPPASCSCRRRAASPTTSSRATACAPAIR